MTDRKLADGRYVAVLDRFEETDPARDSASERASGSEQAGEGESEQAGERERAGESGRARGRRLAVLLLEADGEEVAERHVPAWRLPEEARQSDAVLTVSVRNGHLVSLSYDPDATEQRSSAAQSRFDRLAERPGDESDDADDGES